MKIFFRVLLGVSCLSAVFFGSYIASMRWLKIKHEKVLFKNLPENLNGLRILHISDLHSNSRDKLNLDIWSAVEKEAFDIAVLTGDLIINELEEIYPVLPYLKKLAKKVPVFFVDGNHEMFVYKEIKSLLEGIGITVLNNEKVSVNVKGFGELSVIGTRDFYYMTTNNRMKELHSFLAKNSGGFKLVLTHQPQIIDEFKKYDLGLVLAGHTHGGQVRLPLFPTLYAPFQGVLPKYGDGWYTVGSNKMYVSRGIGTTVFSIRFFNRPEIAVITLKNEKPIIN